MIDKIRYWVALRILDLGWFMCPKVDREEMYHLASVAYDDTVDGYMYLREIVNESLYNAVDNGYNFIGVSNEDIASELVAGVKQLNRYDEQDLIPHIRRWRYQYAKDPKYDPI